MNYACDYIDIRNTLITFLNTVNTSTATIDLSSDLPQRVKNVVAKDLDLYSPHLNEFPYIAVRLGNKTSEEIVTNSNVNSSRQISFNILLNLVYDSRNASSSDTYLGYMVRNVEANLRNNIALSNYSKNGGMISYMIPAGVEFKEYRDEDSAFNRSAMLTLEVNYYMRG